MELMLFRRIFLMELGQSHFRYFAYCCRKVSFIPKIENGILEECYQERNPHLYVFNMVLHMDEATPHLHVDYIPVATEQTRGLSTRVSMKQALKQQGFTGVGQKQTEWKAWMDRERKC